MAIVNNSFTERLIIIAMMACFSMIFLNESGAIAVTFPLMQQALNLSNNALNWVMNGFLLTAATLLLLGGKLADHYGHRKIFNIGQAIFLIASAICASSQNTWMMISGRVLQAIGASLIYPSGTALISLNFSGERFAKALGSIMGFAYLFVAFGPFIGGLFTDLLNWRWLFWINVPVGGLCLLLALFTVPEDKNTHPFSRLDFRGLIIFIIGLGSLVTALMQGPELGWDSPWILALFVIAVIGLVLFALVELKIQEPLLDMRLFKNKLFLAGNIIFPCTAACFTALVFWAIWLQQTFNYSPVQAGIAMIPATVISLFMLRVAGAWGAKSGPRTPMLVGAILLLIGMYWIAISANTQNYWWLVWGFIFFGFGTPLIIPNSVGIIINSVEAHQRGIASGVYLTLQHVAFSLGFAILAAVISTQDSSHLSILLNSKPEYSAISQHQIHVLLAGKNTISQLNADQVAGLKQSAVLVYTHAFSAGMAAMGVFAIIIFLFTFIFIPKQQKA